MPTTTTTADGNVQRVDRRRPEPEPEIDRYERLLRETGVSFSRERDRERTARATWRSVRDYEFVRVTGTNVIFEFTDGKLIRVRD